ncbi:MAG TPA: hypothetical protein DCE41_15000 [Cytophagales bacterium]|nr:hypothetical protein [Cytophagales bacterium]HAA24042.1 hypothetical protein [Cytophagales bacterium]HAP64693.1 hypothetical protein [Cytophagales bacterium]
MDVQDQPIVNRVANSGLLTIDLEDYYPREERMLLDLKPTLFQEMILREKDFRAWVKEHDWQQYADKHVAVTCTVEAIIPMWAYMLVLCKLQGVAKHAVVGTLQELDQSLFQQALADGLKLEELDGAKVVVKGCGDLPISAFAYGEVTRLLAPIASSIMYGEPCSTVPVYKRPKQKA